MERLVVRPGEDVLVFAGGSGVGSFAIQIARAAGCRVITTVGSAEKKRRALALHGIGIAFSPISGHS